MFRTIPELKRTMSGNIREYVHHFLNHNGFSNIDTMRQIREQHQVKREAEKKLYALNMKMRQDIDEIYDVGKERTEEVISERQITDMITDMAKANYHRYKNALPYSPDTRLEPTAGWVKGWMKSFKGIPGFDKKPSEIQNSMMEITENLREQWDVEYDQIRKKSLPRGY